MQLIAAHVTLRAVRESRGLTSPMLAEKIKDRGVDIEWQHLLSVELGRRRASNALMVAWAEALGLNPRDVRQAAEIRELVESTPGEDDGRQGAA